MIYSSLSENKRYSSLHPLFERAFEFYNTTGRHLSEGRHEVMGEDLILTISTNELRSVENAPLEAHNEYIDIQIVISGTEGYGVCGRELCNNSRGGYDETRDIEFFDDKIKNIITLEANDFVIFFPEDAHAPLIGEGKVKKAIFKIRR